MEAKLVFTALVPGLLNEDAFTGRYDAASSSCIRCRVSCCAAVSRTSLTCACVVPFFLVRLLLALSVGSYSAARFVQTFAQCAYFECVSSSLSCDVRYLAVPAKNDGDARIWSGIGAFAWFAA